MDAIHLPHSISLPTTFGAPGTPLAPGQVVQATVVERLESGAYRLQLPQGTIDVFSDVPLQTGSTITLQVKGTGQNAKLLILADPLVLPAGQHGEATARQPIGEAFIVARGNAASSAAAATARTAASAGDTAVVRDAPSIVPNRPQAPTAPPQPVTPERALTEAVRAAAMRQTGSAPLFADAEQVVQTPSAAVPAPVRAAAAQVLGFRVLLTETLSAADVKQAFQRSGVLLEPQLAAQAQQATPSAMPAPGSDLKAALIVLRQVVSAWAGEGMQPESAAPPASAAPATPASVATPAAAPATATPDAKQPLPKVDFQRVATMLASAAELPADLMPVSADQATRLAKVVALALAGHEIHTQPGTPNALPPPYRGAPLSAQAPVPAMPLDELAHGGAEKLLKETDGAIARTTLLQAASLPDQPGTQRAEHQAQRWTFEIPFMTPQGTAIAQFEVSRDGKNPRDMERESVWRARFSIDVEPMGPVHAMVAIVGEKASVTLWAERAETATRLNDNAAMLSDALRAAELQPADFQFRLGVPPTVARSATPGRFMDRAT